jgi:predicted amidohydrolase YtcJ
MHDHHIHLLAAAASLVSADCSPAAAPDRAALARVLRAHPADARGWVRGVGHADPGGASLDRAALDAIEPVRPVRVQHRSGQLWSLNSVGLAALGIDRDASTPSGVERDARGTPTGRIHRADRWLRARLGPVAPPDLAPLSRTLAARGVDRVTDASCGNGREAVAVFAAARAAGALLQEVVVMGSLALSEIERPPPGIRIGPHKIHLAEAALPALGNVVAAIDAAHALGRNVAIHVVSRVELLFALAAFDAAGVRAGDRLEHVHVAPPACVDRIARRGLAVCTNDALVASRRAEWERTLDPMDAACIADAATFARAGIDVLFGSDAPYGPLVVSRPERSTAPGRASVSS